MNVFWRLNQKTLSVLSLGASRWERVDLAAASQGLKEGSSHWDSMDVDK